MDMQFMQCAYKARGQDDWILAKFSFSMLMDRHEVEVDRNAKRERVIKNLETFIQLSLF